MKTTISLKNLMLIIVGVVLMASSITGIFFGLATPVWQESSFFPPGYWVGPQFPAAYPMLTIGLGFMIGGTIGIYGDTKRKK